MIKCWLLFESELLHQKLQRLLLEVDIHLLIRAVMTASKNEQLAEITHRVVVDGDSFAIKRKLCGGAVSALPKQVPIRIADAFAEDSELHRTDRIRRISIDTNRGILRVRLELGVFFHKAGWRRSGERACRCDN